MFRVAETDRAGGDDFRCFLFVSFFVFSFPHFVVSRTIERRAIETSDWNPRSTLISYSQIHSKNPGSMKPPTIRLQRCPGLRGGSTETTSSRTEQRRNRDHPTGIIGD